MAFLFPGNVFGLSAEKAYVDGVRPDRDALICRLDSGAFESLVGRTPGVDRKLRRQLTRMLDSALELAFMLGRKTALERVASFIRYLSYRQRKLGRASRDVAIPMSRADIADFLGLTSESVCRALTRLRCDGLVRLPIPGVVEMRDLARPANLRALVRPVTLGACYPDKDVAVSPSPVSAPTAPALQQFLERPVLQNAILGLIIVNAIILGLETSPGLMARHGTLLTALDRAILGVFVVEIALRLFVHRLRFFRDPWSVFDFLVVGIALVPATGQLAVLRALRVLRVLRVLSIVPSMRRVVGGLLAAIPGLSSIAMVLGLVFYVFAVITTNLFGQQFPDWFGTLGRSLYTLFQVMTLESWSMGIVRPVMEVYPYAWSFFVPFILIATFTMLNLFIGIIVSAMQSFTDADKAETLRAVDAAREHIEQDLHGEVRALRAEIAALRTLLEQGAAPRA